MVTSIEAITGHDRQLPSALVPRQFWTQALAISANYEGLSSSHYAECRLGPSCSPRVDLLFAIEQCPPGHRLDDDRDLGSLWTSWRTPRSALSRSPMVWFELDDIRSPLAPPASMSVCLIKGYRDWRRPLPETDSTRLGLVDEVVRLSGGGASMAALARRVVECFNCIHISLMAGRDPITHKLYGVVPRHDVREFLDTIGWRGPSDEIDQLIAHHFQPRWCDDDIYIDLTLEGLHDLGGNRIGLVFPQQHVIHSDRDATRRALLEHLVASRLCTPQQAEELVAWARDDEALVHGEWMRLHRWFDIKIVWDPCDGISSKAYLGFDARPAGLFD